MSAHTIDAVLVRIRAFRVEANMSYSALATRSGLSRAALVGMDKSSWSPTADTLRCIERVIHPAWTPGDTLLLEVVRP